jgi:hypothetical protein
MIKENKALCKAITSIMPASFVPKQTFHQCSPGPSSIKPLNPLNPSSIKPPNPHFMIVPPAPAVHVRQNHLQQYQAACCSQPHSSLTRSAQVGEEDPKQSVPHTATATAPQEQQTISHFTSLIQPHLIDNLIESKPRLTSPHLVQTHVTSHSSNLTSPHPLPISAHLTQPHLVQRALQHTAQVPQGLGQPHPGRP